MINDRKTLQGSIVALVTPMHADGSLDLDSLDKLVEFHIEQGSNAIVAVGTTGESATLTSKEHLQVVERVVNCSSGRIPVIAGTGANSTGEALELSRAAQNIGVDACLLVVPYYNKPTQEGLYRHFMTLADKAPVDQILYNVPGRTITDIANDVVLRLAEHDNVVGIKDATGDLDRGKQLIDEAPDGFAVYSGDDFTAHELMLLGAEGNISVTANVAPHKMADLCRLSMEGRHAECRNLQEELMPLHQSLFTESSPIPVKWALYEMRRIPEGIRLPLTPLSVAQRTSLRQVLSRYSLIA
ncbi:MAG: 4-hydroxy-tetrahydrodipicolinate synthase [Cellvibrionaceae bacterium]|jgi:4-hydroxy-tetrahydrodipicolinate synthase